MRYLSSATNQTTIASKYIVPMDLNSSEKVLEDHAITIGDDGKIVDILPINDAKSKYTSAEFVDLGEKVCTPGFINAHTRT